MKPSLAQSALFAEQRLAGDVARSERRCSIRSAGREESVERPMITLEQLDAITAAAGERRRSLIDMAAEPDRHGGMVWGCVSVTWPRCGKTALTSTLRP